MKSTSMQFFRTGIMVCVAIYLSGFPAQVTAQAVKEIKIGMLQSWFRADGSEPEHGYLKIQQAGLEWPALFRDQDNEAAKALWIGTRDYTDATQYGGNTYNYKVVHVGPRGWDTEREFIPQVMEMHGRFDHPMVYVDDIPASELMWSDVVEVVDPNLDADRMIYNVVNTSIGITMTRKIYGWSQQKNDDYFIYEYVYKNTGNVDSDDEIEKSGQQLQDVYFFYQFRYAPSKEGATATSLNSPRWGINAMLSSKGEASSDTTAAGFTYPGDYEEWLNGNSGADSLRATFTWAGRHSDASHNLVGYPDVSRGTGRLQGPQYVGLATLHADKSPTDKSDDPQQPTTTTYQQSDDPPTRPNDQFDATRMAEEWQWITKGHRLPRHYEAVGTGYPDEFEGTPGGFSNMVGYGPYQMNFGDSIRIVLVEAVNGLSRNKSIEVGYNWINETGNYTLPDGGTTTDKNEYKNAWVYTGEDSLMKTFGKARRNYELVQQGQEIVKSPEPPLLFTVNSGGDRITLTWTPSVDEGEPWFGGYRIYRAVARYDTTFDMIAEIDPTNENYEYQDKSVVRGFSYYYYLTAVRNDEHQMESSLFWTRTIEPAYLRRQAGSLETIRVVPNPYNIAANSLQFPGQPDKITFYDIPGECTIKIFTERGDLIKTIEHRDGSGDESWNSTTEYGQVIVSGLYIAVFETPDGRKAYEKFVVIR